MPFEKFRMRLVDLMDNLLELLENNGTFVFHLDAQTIILERSERNGYKNENK